MTVHQMVEENDFEGLQQDFNDKSELIRRLRHQLNIETDEVLRFKYEKKIEILETEREQINIRLRQVKSREIYNSLLKLDYKPQERLFHKFSNHSVLAFIIHGCSRDYGQDWLVNQLLNNIQFRTSDQPIWINLYSPFVTASPQEMWKEFRRRFGGVKDSPKAIAQRIYDRWKTQNVCIVVDNINFLPEDLFQDLINELWIPLATEAQDISSQTPYKLMMFFIDNEDQITNWNIPFANIYEADWNCCVPVKLPGLEDISNHHLHDWIQDQLFNLPRQMTDNIDQAVEFIWQNSELGKPLPVMQAICDICECEWIDAWLK
jgi:inactive STAND